jgi:hypothetical protein
MYGLHACLIVAHRNSIRGVAIDGINQQLLTASADCKLKVGIIIIIISIIITIIIIIIIISIIIIVVSVIITIISLNTLFLFTTVLALSKTKSPLYNDI